MVMLDVLTSFVCFSMVNADVAGSIIIRSAIPAVNDAASYV